MTERTSTRMHIYVFCISKSHCAEKAQLQKYLRKGFTEGAKLLPRRQENDERGIQVPRPLLSLHGGSKEGRDRDKGKELKIKKNKKTMKVNILKQNFNYYVFYRRNWQID